MGRHADVGPEQRGRRRLTAGARPVLPGAAPGAAPLGCAAMQHEERLAATGIRLPSAPRPAAQYVPCVRSGNLLYVSGQGPATAEGFVTGKVGQTIDEAAA